jgi:predicted RecA/RadA family phage recombinase
MALTKFIHDGAAVDYIPGADVAAGDVVVQADLVGIARVGIPANTLGTLAVTGVFEVPKATGVGTALASGTTVYWDAANQRASTTSSGNKLLGKVVKAAADADAVVWVRLTQ